MTVENISRLIISKKVWDPAGIELTTFAFVCLLLYIHKVGNYLLQLIFKALINTNSYFGIQLSHLIIEHNFLFDISSLQMAQDRESSGGSSDQQQQDDQEKKEDKN